MTNRISMEKKVNKKILLIRPNFDSYGITPPLGIGYLSSYLKKQNIEVKIIDGLRDKLSNKKILDLILNEYPCAVGLTCLSSYYQEVVNLALLIKKNNIKCIIGGIHPSFLPYKTLIDTKADFVICGEGEIALSKLIQNNFVNCNIKGVYSLGNLKDEKQEFEKAEIIENLDEIPFPDWEQIDPRTYPKAPQGVTAKHFPIGIILTSRGCPYSCVFCVAPNFYNHKIRFRSPENVVAEIKYLVKKFNIREIHFADDNLTFDREHIERICNLIIENNLNIVWACPNGIRADKVDEDLIKLMKKSGCYYFAYGIESADPQILKNIKKSENIQTIENSINLANKNGISCQGFFIFGLPGETNETIKKTIDFAVNSNLQRAYFQILNIVPGCELWLKKYCNKITKNDGATITLSRKDLSAAQAKAFFKFYLRPHILFKFLNLIKLDQVKILSKRIIENIFAIKQP